MSKKFIKWVHLNEIKVIAFDLDKTLTSSHSRGVLKKTDLPAYIDSCSEYFKAIILDLLEEKDIHVAITSYTDVIYYLKYNKEDYLAGWDLANAFLKGIGLNDHHLDLIIKLCRFPSLHKEKCVGKLWHLDKLKTIFNISPHNILLLDDSSNNVLNSKPYRAIKICGESLCEDDIPLQHKLTEEEWLIMIGEICINENCEGI